MRESKAHKLQAMMRLAANFRLARKVSHGDLAISWARLERVAYTVEQYPVHDRLGFVDVDHSCGSWHQGALGLDVSELTGPQSTPQTPYHPFRPWPKSSFESRQAVGVGVWLPDVPKVGRQRRRVREVQTVGELHEQWLSDTERRMMPLLQAQARQMEPPESRPCFFLHFFPSGGEGGSRCLRE